MERLDWSFALVGFSALLVGASSATATVIDLSTVGFGPVTYFAGTQQESTITFEGCPGSFGCEIPVDLTQGVPASVITHTAEWDLGVNNGILPGPDEATDIETVFSAAGNSVSIFQTARLRQIGNDQFQFDLGESDTQILDLGDVGSLHITGLKFAGQARSNFNGRSLFRSTLLLVIPEPSGFVLLCIGTLGYVGQRKVCLARMASH